MSIEQSKPAASQAIPSSAGVREAAIRYGFLVLLAGMILYFSLVTGGFASPQSAVFILQSVSITGILALGVTATLVVGGFDLSIGSIATTAMMASSYVMVVLGGDALTATLVCFSIGVLIGLINGIIIVYMRVPDLLATLGMMFLLLGLQRIPTEGRSIAAGMTLPDGTVAPGTFSPAFLALGRHRFDFVLPNLVPVSVVVLIILAVVIWFFLEYTRFGRMMYAVGSNERAASLAGAPVNAYKIWAYIISGVFGILLAARLGRGDIASGNNLLLDAVAAALIGFAVLGATKPNAFGTAVGALFVGILLQGLTMMNAPYYTQDFVKGAVLVIALIFTFALSKRGRR
ncbi:ABC transporter permease [Sinorhizobium medicae]|uniref:ABC transporter permease n=1 Tax=Sinorhizobium medicae TaxID=110321 RepID=UPI001296F348|nr:ABC transporter permease [Sinorhizobium medicae]MQV49937.1 ABC transporter permease [Sinorhizobium medicae]MQV50022.1 ABC transporter permease [Sinorhizobium medicae]MQV53454.1 ABC transporter permease [Sinorhizobium medicae]MQV75365.1 ABC transporter permease [Sinorhizobium medicae]